MVANTQMEELICIPGQRICPLTEETISGEGTYERGGYIYSNLAGVLKFRKSEKITYIDVISPKAKTILPIPGDVVTCRVQVVNQRFAKCLIIGIGDVVLTRHLRGILRKEDVRATDKDRVEIYKCFRPGDIILAKVLPQTELHTYQLTTAENELGVVVATYRGQDVPMTPIGWTEMQCPVTLAKEPRKVARLMTENQLQTLLKTEVKDEKMEE
ncbi:exosome complex component CSL4 [Culicoides brevitarsis]|uniref:exosome complex component CSL4 n=1 Tax=Culicoides brevitarsis TaxID=469753 RepID=UPI00307BCCF2